MPSILVEVFCEFVLTYHYVFLVEEGGKLLPQRAEET
jgi:hypothetical protein